MSNLAESLRDHNFLIRGWGGFCFVPTPFSFYQIVRYLVVKKIDKEYFKK